VGEGEKMMGELLAKDIALSVFTAWLVAQVVFKVITFSYKKKEFFWRAAFMGGGMPSGHSALVASLCTAIGLSQGFDSAMFIVALVFSIIVIYEALHEKKVIVGFLEVIAKKNPKKDLLEQLGHSTMEVVAGIAIGIVVVLAFYYR
jgi:acid phosphatase family membrane protein YuiD